jgi:outer membrane protein assembly factor BamA
MPIIYQFLRKTLGKISLPAILALLLLATSCRITKNVPDNQHLLDNSKIKIISKDKETLVKEADIERYIRQKPNKRVIAFRLHLRIYNMAKPGKEKGLSKLFRTIGEEPVLLDTFQTRQSVSNLSRFLESKGYYNARVKDTTVFDKKRATVKYDVYPGEPMRIRNISYTIEDTLIRLVVLGDTLNRVIRKGSAFDMDLLRLERERIETSLKEDGYFFFSREFITFDADTNISGRQVDLELLIRNRFLRTEFGDKIPQKYKKYDISNVFIYTNYDPVEFYYLQEEGLLDTVEFDNQKFIYSLSPGIRYKTISNSNLIRPGQVFAESIVQKTRNNLNSLRLYRAVNIFFRADEEQPIKTVNDDNFLFFNKDEEAKLEKTGKLNCYIQLTPFTLQSYQVDLVGTNTTSDIGVEGNMSYQHKNIFKGAEVLDLKLRGMVQLLTGENYTAGSYEMGGSVGLNFPRFLSPFSGQEHINKYSPRTQITTSYNFQKRPEYTRTVAALNFGYSWKAENKFSYTFNPVEINIINIYGVSDRFWNNIKNTYLANSYKNQLVTLTSYGFIFSNQANSKKDFSVLRFNAEVSGNTLYGLFSLLKMEKDNGSYKIFETSFSQFVRSDINYIFNHKIDNNNTIVYRAYAGAGLPYGNSAALPFEKKFFSGGSTGVRAWHARGLGPGTYIDSKLAILNQTADIKLEANIEYRFKLFWMLEGAFFLDAGNIWAISSADERPGALFTPSTFYKEIALGTGTGIRMNLGFFTLRFDLGLKIHDPGARTSTEENPDLLINTNHWIPFDRKYQKSDYVIHFGIGYPF